MIIIIMIMITINSLTSEVYINVNKLDVEIKYSACLILKIPH